MRSTPLSVAVLVASLASAALGIACDDDSCTMAACIDGVNVPDLAIGRKVDALHEGRVRVCRDGACVEDIVTYELPDAGNGSNGFIRCGVPARRPPFTCARAIRGGVIVDDAVDISFVGYSSSTPPREGEVFLVEVRTKDGAVVASRTGAIRYEKQYPNGPECGGSCVRGELKK